MPLSHLTLVVPDLLWADPDLRREATRELPLPALGWLLGRGQARAQCSVGLIKIILCAAASRARHDPAVTVDKPGKAQYI